MMDSNGTAIAPGDSAKVELSIVVGGGCTMR